MDAACYLGKKHQKTKQNTHKNKTKHQNMDYHLCIEGAMMMRVDHVIAKHLNSCPL